MYVNRIIAVTACVLLSAVACGGSDSATASSAVSTDATAAAVAAATATSGDEQSPIDGPTPTPDVNAPVTAGEGTTAEPVDGEAANSTPAATDAPAQQPVGVWPNRFCIDGVETTLNLRAEPTTESEILASIPPLSCDLVHNGSGLEDNFQAVTYTTVDGAVDGWVSNNFIEFQDPPTRIEAAALLFVSAWQNGLDTSPYSYEVGPLPAPIAQGDPVTAEGADGFGCVLVGDVSIDCAIALVDRDGNELARLSIGATQRGTDGNDGEPYFAADFPEGPRVTSFAIVES